MFYMYIGALQMTMMMTMMINSQHQSSLVQFFSVNDPSLTARCACVMFNGELTSSAISDLDAFDIQSQLQKRLSNLNQVSYVHRETRSSADADNRLDAFSGQSRSTNMIPFHKTRRFYDIRLQKISWPWNGGQRSLKVVEGDIIR